MFYFFNTTTNLLIFKRNILYTVAHLDLPCDFKGTLPKQPHADLQLFSRYFHFTKILTVALLTNYTIFFKLLDVETELYVRNNTQFDTVH